MSPPAFVVFVSDNFLTKQSPLMATKAKKDELHRKSKKGDGLNESRSS